MFPEKILILGVTGTIGANALKMIKRWPDRFTLSGFSYYKNFERAREIQDDLGVKHVCCSRPDVAPEEKNYWQGKGVHFFTSLEDTLSIEYDKILIAIVGAVGIRPTLQAICQSKTILIANKESLVMAGEFVMEEVKKNRSSLIPIDSEHNSIFRLLQQTGDKDITKILLTASGGPFHNLTKEEIKRVTKAEVLQHPNWNMGDKITVDSAGLINKSLEVIEAHHLFNRRLEDIDAVIHPQSYVHAILQHSDGSFYFHASNPDMLYPLSHGLFYPEAPPFWIDAPKGIPPGLRFAEIDHDKFPGFALGIQSARSGGAYPAIFNASNEQAVQAFLEDRIRFHEIPQIIERVLNQRHDFKNVQNMEDIFEADQWARKETIQVMACHH